MKKLYKLFALTCALCLVAATLSFTGCGKQEQTPAGSAAVSAGTESLSAEIETGADADLSATEEVDATEETKAPEKTETPEKTDKDEGKAPEATTNSSSSTSDNESTTTEKVEEPAAPSISTGTYSGSHVKNVAAMGANIYYSYSITLNDGGSYTYKVSYYSDMGGTNSETVSESESGSYTVDGNKISFSNGTSGTWSGNSMSVTRHVSERSSSADTISVSK